MRDGKTFRKILNIIAIIILLGGLMYTFYNYKQLPDTVAIHFNFNGEPNGWGSKITVWILPIIAIVMYAILALLSRYPNIYNYPCIVTNENREKLYNIGQNMITVINLETVLLFTYIDYNVIKSAVIGQLTMKMLSIGGVLIILTITIGYYIYKLYKAK